MNIKIPTKLLTLLITVGFIYACADAPQRTEETSTEDSTMVETEIMEEDEDFSFMLPSPIQIAAIFNRAGLEFQSELTNPVSNYEKYNTKTSRYLNFGVYSADLAYAVLNDQQQLSIDYMNVVKKLTEDIGMPSIFGSGELLESFEKNVGNQDTILRILTTIKRRTDQYLEENSENSKESVFFSAAWVEGMYLGANSGTNSEKITPRLIEQMTILDNVIKALNYQNDETLELDYLINDLSAIRDAFESYESIKSMAMENTELGDVQLTDAELKDMTSKINALRTKIVNG